MGVFTAALGWLMVALVSGAIAIRARRSPLDQPIPTAVAGGAVFGLTSAVVDLPFAGQAAVGTTSAVVLLLLFLRWRALGAEDHLPPGVGGSRLIGLQGEVVEPIGPDSGRVRVGADVWRAAASDDHPLTVGTAVTIIAVEGIHVVVSSVSRSAELDHRGL